MPRENAKTKLLNAALALIRERGFSATTVDALCERAGVTKGAFFHHFKSKNALGAAAAEHWSAVTGALFKQAAYHAHEHPLDRLFAYIELRRGLLEGEISEVTCVVGTLVQEAYADHPKIRDACAESIFGHANTLVADIEAAKARCGVTGDWTAESLAAHTQAVMQGAFILAKAKGNMAIARESVDHLTRYIELLFAGAERPRGDLR